MKTITRTSLLLLFLLTLSCKQKDIWIKPKYSPITEALFASGHIEPADQFILTAFSDGYLQRTYVKESDVVSVNNVLFSLDYQSKAIEEEAAKENLQIARLNASSKSPTLLKLQNDLYAAQQKCSLDSIQFARLKQLYVTQSVSQVDVENMRLQYEVDMASVKSIQANMKSTQLALQQALIQAESQYNSYNAGNQYYSMRSPHTARIYQIFKKPGELIRKGEAVALLGNPDSLVVMLQVDEASISKIKEGQTVLVELNTDKAKMYEALVSRIYPYFDNATQSFQVEALFTHPFVHHIAGTLLQANIIVAKKDSALLIPRTCLSPDGKATVKRDGKRKIITLHTGIISTEWVEVLSDLDTEDEVLQNF